MSWFHNLVYGRAVLREENARLRDEAVKLRESNKLLVAENKRLTETNELLAEDNEVHRQDNRALTNTILGQAGVAPLASLTPLPKLPERKQHLTRHQQQRRDQIVEFRDSIKMAEKFNVMAEERVANGSK